MQKISLPTDQSAVRNGVEFIEQTLRKYRFKNKEVMKTLLMAEESMVRLINRSDEGGEMQVSVRYWYGTADITISAAGDPFGDAELEIDLSAGDMGHDSEETIRSILLKSFADKMTYTRKGEYNFVRISVGVKEQVFLLRTLVALVLGAIVATLLLLCMPHSTAVMLADRVLFPIQTIYLNALQLVTAPTVFFCILTNVSRYASLSDPGKISRRVVAGYLMTSVIAVLIGMVIFIGYEPLIRMENFLVPYVGYQRVEVSLGNTILEMIVNIVPTNIVTPFYDTNAMQLLLLALLGGVALGSTGQYSAKLREAADALDSFFSRIAEIVSYMIPTATFFTTILCIAYFDFRSIYISLEVFFLAVLGLAAMILCYCVLVLVCRLNPLTLLRKFAPGMVGIFLSGSSIQALPETMQVCEKKLGVSPKVYSFSIPFGAIGNMDGNCIYLTIAGLYLSKLCGAEFLGQNLISIIFAVVLLSVGSPITSGSVMIALMMLANTVGFSPVGLSFIIGINVIIEMLLAVCNTIGDVAITLVVARTEGLIDLNVYRGEPTGSKRKK